LLRRRPPSHTSYGAASLPDSPPTSTQTFVIVAFIADADAVLHPVLPTQCPSAASADGRCRLRIDHYRDRKTGPTHALPVFRCADHPERRFTGYPPGFAPYQRQPVIFYSASGTLLRDAEHNKICLDATLFQASRDAAVGIRWPKQGALFNLPSQRTQERHLDQIMDLLGVHPAQDDAARERQATCLDVDALAIRDAAATAAKTRCWTQHGRAAGAVLNELCLDDKLLDRLMNAGHEAGLWPAPQRWDIFGRCHRRAPTAQPRKRRVRDGPDLGQRPAHEESPS